MLFIHKYSRINSRMYVFLCVVQLVKIIRINFFVISLILVFFFLVNFAVAFNKYSHSFATQADRHMRRTNC